MLFWIQFATICTVSSYVMLRGKSKLLVCCVKMVINPEYTHKNDQVLLMALFHPTVTWCDLIPPHPTPAIKHRSIK